MYRTGRACARGIFSPCFNTMSLAPSPAFVLACVTFRPWTSGPTARPSGLPR
jgi:hypothetical protein